MIEMTEIDYEKQINNMNMSQRYNFISSILDESIQASLLSFLDDHYTAKVIASFKDESLILQSLFLLKPSSTKLDLIKGLSSDEEKVKYLGEFDAYDQVRIVNSFTDDEVKLSVLSSFSSNNQVTIIKTIEDLNVLDRAFAFVDSQWDRAAIIKTRTSDEDKLFLFKHLTDSYNSRQIAITLSTDEAKIKAMDSISSDSDKAAILLTFSSEESIIKNISLINSSYEVANIAKTLSTDDAKISVLGFIQADSYKSSVLLTLSSDEAKLNNIHLINNVYDRVPIIKSFTDEANIVKALPYIKGNYQCSEIISNLSDENVKLSLLNLLDDYNRVEIIKTFSSAELKYKGFLTLESNFRKDDVLRSFTDYKYIKMGLDTYDNDWSKKNLVSSLEDDNIKIQLLSVFSKDSDKADIIKSFKDESLKTNCISSLSDEYAIKNVVVTLENEQDRFKYLETLKDDYAKSDIIETLTSQDLLINALTCIKSSYQKKKIIGKFTDENTILSLISYLDDYEKIEFIDKFSSDELKLKGLETISSDYPKVGIIKGFKEFSFIEKGIKLLKDVYQISSVINSLDNDNDKITLIKYIEDDSSKASVIAGLSSDESKISCLGLLKSSYNMVKVISSFSDDNNKFNQLDKIQNDWDKVSVVSSIKDEELLSKGLMMFKNDSYRANVLVAVKDDRLKVKFLSLIADEPSRIRIIKTINEDLIKVETLCLLSNEKSKVDVINSLKDEQTRLSLVPSLESNENKFLVITSISSIDLKNEALRSIDNYKDVMDSFFEKGKFEYLYQFDKDILRDVFDKKQIAILEEYTKIKNENIRNTFSKYVISNYENLNMVNLSKISQVLSRIELSNSSELQAFGDLIANQVLNSKDPIRYFNKVEDVFIRNNIPYVGKIFEVFKLLHTNEQSYRNYSPLLNRFTSDVKNKVMDMIIFNDLLKCSFGSNNRNLKEFIDDVEKGSILLDVVMKDTNSIDSLNDKDRFVLNKYLDRIEIILSSYDEWKFNTSTYSNKDFLLRIKAINERLNVKGSSYKDIPDIIMRKLCGVSGINSLASAKEYFKFVIEDANNRNRERANGDFVLEPGDFVKGINDVKYLSRILQNGSVSKEFLGESSDSDLTPLDTDLSRVLLKDTNGKNGTDLGDIISSTLSGSYGSTWFVLKNDPERIEITRDETGERNRNLASKFSKLEAFKTLSDDHYGIRTGFPTSEISYIVSRDNFERISLEVAMNGFYIPVVDTKGKLMFTPEDYDLLREKMAGLKYYDNSSYTFSDNLVNDDVVAIASQIESSNIEVERKRELINSKIRESLLDMDLIFKDNIDGDLSEGIVELVDTGSTGRGTNKPGDGDFDFMMRLDKSIISNPDRLDELKDRLLTKFGVQGKSQVTATGDFRLKGVGIDSDTNVDIDITFIGKTDKVSYSTDMCLSDRLSSIKQQDPEKYNYVVANILLAKQVLKQGECYKPNRGEVPQGGLGGVGVENWILQNGGSFVDAARSFVEASEGLDFESFKSKYKIWDFGENHMAEKNENYAHDEFVSRNMSSDGYNKMVSTLKTYLKDYSFDVDDSKKVI